MKPESLIGTWKGVAQNSNGWEMQVTISITEPVQAGRILGTYTIPEIPCTGKFRVLEIHGEVVDLKAEELQGDCGEADSDSLELLADGTLMYVSKGEGWEARGVLYKNL